MKLFTKITVAAAAVVAIVGTTAKSALDDLKAASSAYLYGYSLVLSEETRIGSVALTGTNRFSYSNDFPDGDFRLVVRPNVDTLYNIVWFDLSEGAQVISMPNTGDRYYVMPFMDAWTNVFARTGTSTTGNHAQEIALVGPEFKGELPQGISSVVTSPTNMVWMIGRIQTNSVEDVANVEQLQSQMAVTPLAAWEKGERYPGQTTSMADAEPHDPMNVVESMDAQAFFSYLNRMMAEQPPLPGDGPELAKFAHLNIAPGADFQMDKLGWLQRIMVEKALEVTRTKIDEALRTTNITETGWNVLLEDIGTYGTNYQMRTVVAKVGIGALIPEEASYPSSFMTPDGEKLNGDKYNYRLHFPAGEAPGADAFWSLTMYDFEGYMKNNEIDRYSIGDRSGLQFNTDGSLDILIQHQRPEQGTSNWLPAPQEEFNVTLRMYLAHDNFLNGEWTLPALEKVEIL